MPVLKHPPRAKPHIVFLVRRLGRRFIREGKNPCISHLQLLLRMLKCRASILVKGKT
jgi:hypothetical protein